MNQSGWAPCRLGDALETLIDHRGKTPGKLGGTFTDSGVPVISAIHIKNGAIDFSQRARFVTHEMYLRWMRVPLCQGDVLMTSEAPMGSVALVNSNDPLVLSQRLYAMRGREGVLDNRFLRWALIADPVRRQLEARSSGTTVLGIRQSEPREVVLRLPSVSHQRRIVDILEDHLSRLDAADAGLVNAQRRMAVLRERLVRDAITGSGVSGQRHASDLIEAGTRDGDLPTLPVGWAWRRLGEVADVAGGVTKDANKQGNPDFVEVPYLRVANVQRAELRLENVTTIRVAPSKAQALRLEPGDVLLNEGGDRDKLARGWVWAGQVDDCIHQNHVFRARVRGDLDPYFLSWTANTIGARWAEGNGKQSVNLASISLSMIRRMPVIVPPGDLSRAIVEELHGQLASVDRVAAELKSARTRGLGLRRALLAAAFSGKLTGRHADREVIEELASV